MELILPKPSRSICLWALLREAVQNILEISQENLFIYLFFYLYIYLFTYLFICYYLFIYLLIILFDCIFLNLNLQRNRSFRLMCIAIATDVIGWPKLIKIKCIYKLGV